MNSSNRAGPAGRRAGERLSRLRPLRAALARATAALLIALAMACPARAAEPDLPDFARYQLPLRVDFDAGNAALGIPDRAGSVIGWNACGREIDFFESDGKRAKGEDDVLRPNGDPYAQVIAKIAWIAAHPRTGENYEMQPPPCRQEARYFAIQDVQKWKSWPAGINHTYAPMAGWSEDAGFGAEQPEQRVKLWNEAFKERWGEECANVLRHVAKRDFGGATAYSLSFSVSRACMVAQINRALLVRQKVGQPGTEGLPCRIFSVSHKGDWDMAVSSLLRAVYLDKRAFVIDYSDDAAAGVHVFNNLLSLSGELEPETYGLLQCGNSENDSGSAQDRADEEGWYNDGFFGGLGDLLDWLWKWLLVALMVGAVFYGLWLAVGYPAFIIGGLAGLAVVFGTQVRVPETENHLLMINSSKYLTNQLMLESFTDQDDIDRYTAYQEDIRDWLLQRLQRISREDFMEYNARPYQRLSIGAILNIHDFADHDGDERLREAARIVLEYASAKFAVGSNQGRRLVPFRRLVENNRQDIFGPGAEGMKPRRIADFGGGADHQLAAMLLFTGQAQQLPTASDMSRKLITSEMAGEMIWEATSTYRPSEVVLDLAIDKSVAYEQRFHHGGFETYSSAPGFLVTAGGIVTPNALGMAFTPFAFNVTPPFALALKNADRGTGLPTTLMVASGWGRLNRNDFLRIEGAYGELPHEDRNPAIATGDCETDKDRALLPGCRRNLTNDHNLCVRKGFACGMNLRIPADITAAACVRPAPGGEPGWGFIDSTTCPPYRDAPPFYVVLLQRPCPPGHEYCKSDWGFFEAVDRTLAVPSFADFMTQTVANNPNAMLAPVAEMIGTYNSWRGERIDYSAEGHLEDDNTSGISGVDSLWQGDIDDWPLAEGDAINADGVGNISITAPARQPAPGRIMRVRMDFTDWENPVYEELQ